MPILNYSTAFNALDLHVKLHNQNTKGLSNKIRQATEATAKNIIKIYGLSLLKANNVQKIDLSNLPPLKTNNVQLAKLGNASPRTIQRHIKRLISCKVIIQKVWRGSNSSYELKINPDILLINAKKDVYKSQNGQKSEKKKDTENQFFKNSKATTCPHTDSSNNSYINNIIIGVDKLKTQMSSLPLTDKNESRNATSNAFSGYTGEKCPKKNDSAGGNAREKRVTEETSAEKSPSVVTRPASLKPFVDSLWKLARNTLYKNHYLTESQIKKGQDLLYDWYLPVAKEKLTTVHQVYVDRIAIVEKYLAKAPLKRYVQLPNKYFNPTNPSGFAGTKSWYYQQKEREKELQLKLILNAQVRRFLNNERKDTYRQQPRLELFIRCETRLGKLGKPELVNAFHAAVLEHNTHKFLH